MKGLARKGGRAPSRNAEGDKRDSNGAGHHEGERRVPRRRLDRETRAPCLGSSCPKGRGQSRTEGRRETEKRGSFCALRLEHVVDEEDRQKACAHERQSRRERATRRDQTWPARPE